MFQFKQATKQQSKLRMTLDGPAGSGKTFTALRFGHFLARGGKIAVIDTERGSASKYVGESPDGQPWAFDVAELTTFAPSNYVEVINAAGLAGYAVLIIDSMSHAWEGKGGALEMRDKASAEQRTKNDFTAWRAVTPEHNRLVDAILQSSMHVICTMRSRIEYVLEEDDKGKKTPRKVGMAPIQRPGMEYEFDLVADIDIDHNVRISKSRCSAMADATANRPGPSFISPLVAWLESGSADALKEVERQRELKVQAKTLRDAGQPPRAISETLGVSITDVLAWTVA